MRGEDDAGGFRARFNELLGNDCDVEEADLVLLGDI